MTLDKIESRVLMRYCWKRPLPTRDAAKEICDAEGEGTVNYTTVSRRYKRFDSGDLSLEDQSCFGRPSTLDNEDLWAPLKDEPSLSSRELASVLEVSSHQTAQSPTSNGFCAQVSPGSKRVDRNASQASC